MPDLVEDYVACRICMDSKHSYVSIFSQDLSAKVMVLADVQVEKNDGLPESICSECEHDLEKCYEFRIKVQTSDKKFRENMSQVDIEECNIKEESYMDEIASDNVDDKDSDRKEDDRYNDVPETLQKAPEETREAVPDPLNHVVVVGENERMCEMSKESLNKHDTMIEESQVLEMEEVAFDSLECMKEEAEAMDVDSNQRDPLGSSSVSDTALPISMIPPVCTSVDVKRENEILTGNSKPRIAPRITDCHQQLTGTKRQRRILPAIKHQERGINCVNNNEVNQPNQSLMLLPQTAFNLNTGILVKCVKFTPRNIVIPKNLANTLDSTPPLISFQNSATTFENFTLPSAPVDASSLKNYMCSVATGTQKESEQGADLPDLACKDLDENHQKPEDEDPNEDKVRSIEQQKLLPNFMSTLSSEDAKAKNEYVVEKNQKQILSKQTHSQLISSSCIGNALKVPHVGLESVLLVNSAPGTLSKYPSSQNHGNSQDGDHLNKTSNFHDIQSKKTTICHRAEDSVQINNIKTTDMMTSARIYDNTLSSKVRAVDKSVKISSDTNSKQSTTAQPPKTESDTDSKEEYFCSVCNVDFGFPDRLEEHKSGKEFICRSCATIFNNHRDLEAHFYNHRKYMCKVCKKCFYVKSDLLHHKDTVASCKRTEVLKCRYCHNRFVHKSNLLAHIEVKHPNAETRPFNCNICDSSFKCQATLREHLKSCHTVYESVECDICHKILPGPSSLKTHVKNRHLQTESGVCPVCNKVLSSKHSVKLHMEIHTGEEKVCYICGAVVKGKKTFKQHIYHHENRKRYCSFCNLEFDSPTEKNRHYREKHSISKSCICEICGKEFKAREILRSHMLTHSDVKSFKCGVCGAAFKSKAVLKTHSRVHSDLRKYTCHLCGEAFRWKQTFDKHVLKCELSQSEARLKT